MGDDYVVIKLWEKVFLEKNPMFKLSHCRLFPRKIICRSNKDDAIMKQ